MIMVTECKGEVKPTPTRNEKIINNILAEICKCCDFPEDQYIPWLKEEVGLTDNEIERLQAVNCLPTPV